MNHEDSHLQPLSVKYASSYLSENNQAEQEFRLSLLKALAARLRGGVVPLALPEATPEALDELLRGCGATGIPVPLEGGLRLPLKRFLTRFDAQPGEYAICLDKDTLQALSLTQTCYGQYIDTKLLDQTLGTPALLSYGTACTAVLLACEAGTKLLAGFLAGAVEAGTVCWLPQTIALTQKDDISRNLRESGELSLSTELLIPWSGWEGLAAGAAGSFTIMTGVRAAETWLYSYVKGRRAAELYLKALGATKTRPYSRLFYTRNQLERLVKASFKNLVEGTPVATAEFTAETMAKVLTKLEPGDERVLRLLISKLETAEAGRELIKGITSEGRAKLYTEFIQKLPELVAEGKKEKVLEALQEAGYLSKQRKVEKGVIDKLLKKEDPLKEIRTTLDDVAEEAAKALDNAVEAAEQAAQLTRTQRAKNLIKEALKSAPCAAAGAIAGTLLTARTTGGLTPETLTLTLTTQNGRITAIAVGGTRVGTPEVK